MPKPTLEERFWAKVDKHGPVPEHRPDLGPCWVWTGARKPGGYGYLEANGRTVRASRFAFELLIGPIPGGLPLDHLCVNPPCVKAVADEFGPAHLEPVTARENCLRGNSPAAQRARRTHCPQGHPYDEANTYRDAQGRRYCRACKREQQRERSARRLAAGIGPPPDAPCKYGHPRYMAANGRWCCRECDRRRARENMRRRRAACE